MRSLLFVLLLLCGMQAGAGSRYLTWVDDLGRVHNTFVDERFAEQQRLAQRRAEQSDQARLGDAGVWPGSAPSTGESKRRYFTWVDGSGQLHNSFYAGAQIAGASGRDQVLASGERAGDYIDSQVLEGRGFLRDGDDSPYFTWVDEQGRMHNSPVPTASRNTAATQTAVRYTEGRQIEFERSKPALPMLDGQPTAAMQALLAGSEVREEGLYGELVARCCGQLRDSDFKPLSADEPRFEELDRFSPASISPWGAATTRR